MVVPQSTNFFAFKVESVLLEYINKLKKKLMVMKTEILLIIV